MKIDQAYIDQCLKEAASNPRLRQGKDFRNGASDTSQRLLNALLPHTQVPIHRHMSTSETVICLSGRLDEILFEEQIDPSTGHRTLRETERIHLCPAEGCHGCQVPQGVWHKVEVIEPSIIFEAKDGAYAPPSPDDVWAEPEK